MNSSERNCNDVNRNLRDFSLLRHHLRPRIRPFRRGEGVRNPRQRIQSRHGSAAERAGIKRGQIVKSINGKPMRTRSDIEFYCKNDAEIKSVEVANEK